MSLTHIIVPAAGLQPFEKPFEKPFEIGAQGVAPFSLPAAWQEEAAERIELHEDSLCLPWEIAYARALEIASIEGKMPWAAFETQTLRQPCAWVHPCHLDVGMTDMVMQPTSALRLTDAESRELHALMAPYFEQDGITLRYHSATRWLALGEQFADFECATLARVQGRSINDFLPDAGEFPQQLKLSRLQAEMQMLLYTHPSSDARQARGLPTVNSFWVDGAGALDALPQPKPQSAGSLKLELRLQEAQNSESAYAHAWRSLLAQWQAEGEQAIAAGSKYGVTLCGEKSAITLWAGAPSFKHKFLSLLGRLPANNVRGVL